MEMRIRVALPGITAIGFGSSCAPLKLYAMFSAEDIFGAAPTALERVLTYRVI
jgi:hypothetical protein